MGVVAASYLLGGYITAWENAAVLQTKRAAFKPQELGIMTARKDAIENRKWLETYEAISHDRHHLPILDGFLKGLGPAVSAMKLELWEYDNGRLSATLRIAGSVDIREVVKSLEAQPLFKGVNSETNALQKSVKLTMLVVPGGKS